MNETEWVESTDPIAMLEFLRGSPVGEDTVSWGNNRWQLDEPSKGNDRKFRLFACACCRRIWEQLPFQCNQDAVAAVETFLDGHLPGSAVMEALSASSAVEWKEDGSGRRSEPGYWIVKYLGRGFYKMTAGASALLVASQVIFMSDEEYGRQAECEFNVCYYAGAGVFLRPFQWPFPVSARVVAERAAQASLLRCLFGNPFRPMVIDPLWLTPTVTDLAQAAYEDRTLPSGELNTTRLAVLADALEDAQCDDPNILNHLRGPERHVRGCWILDQLVGRG